MPIAPVSTISVVNSKNWVDFRRCQLLGRVEADAASDPLLLELDRREIAQGRVDAPAQVDVLQEAPNLVTSISIVLLLGKVDLLFFDRAHQALSKAGLGGLADLGHANRGRAVLAR